MPPIAMMRLGHFQGLMPKAQPSITNRHAEAQLPLGVDALGKAISALEVVCEGRRTRNGLVFCRRE